MEYTSTSTRQKALVINLNPAIYGSFAEIGAGQEVARNFFQAGVASGTIAQSLSAYDMVFSDAIYGRDDHGRYVCKPRLMKMVEHEFKLLQDRLKGEKTAKSQFFAFANTVATSSASKRTAHGWLGIRFQTRPEGPVNDVVAHVKLKDNLSIYQQEALGIFGVNLIYAAYYFHSDPSLMLECLMDNLGQQRVEVNFVSLKGEAFASTDERLINLELVRRGYTDAVLFDEKGQVVLAEDELYRKNVQVVRGSFRPPTLVNQDIMNTGLECFSKTEGIKVSDIVSVAELTMNNLHSTGFDSEDFLARVNLLSTMKQKVLVTNFPQYYKLIQYFNNFKAQKIGLILGGYNFKQIFDLEYNKDEGGIFSALGQLFQHNVKVYVYPYKNEVGDEYIDLTNLEIPEQLKHLYRHLCEGMSLVPIQNFNEKNLHIFSRRVHDLIQRCQPGWEEMVPSEVADYIKKHSLFGFDLCKVK